MENDIRKSEEKKTRKIRERKNKKDTKKQNTVIRDNHDFSDNILVYSYPLSHKYRKN
ncbi:MAG: hypothetical protein ACXACU_14880 [Candidatus Hodarchaeales archaeon]|jgi:hypothetical protein